VRHLFYAFALWCVLASTAAAQQRPLPTEDAVGIGGGEILVETATDYSRNVQFPLSGLAGNLWRVGLIRLQFGLSSIAEFDLSGGLRDHLFIDSSAPAPLTHLLNLSSPAATGAFDDIIVGTKVTLIPEATERPAVAIRVATRLPNSKHPSGLGQNTIDFFASALASHSIDRTRLTVNAGIGVLGDPLASNHRVNSLLYGAMVDRQVDGRFGITAGVDGRTGPNLPGLEPRAISRAGLVWTRGRARFELDGTYGLTDRDGAAGVALSAGLRFHAFQ
jgi:hypothetical protein